MTHRHRDLGASRGHLQNWSCAHILTHSRGRSKRYHVRVAPREKNFHTGKVKTRHLTMACNRSLCFPGSLACLRTQPFDSIWIFSSPEFVAMKRRVWGWNPCSLRGALAARSCTLIRTTHDYVPWRVRRWRNSSPRSTPYTVSSKASPSLLL